MAQPAILFGLAQFDDPHQTIGPFDQFFGMTSRSRQQLVQLLRCADQSVLGALGLGQHFVKQALANSEGRKHDGLRLGDPNDVFENQRGIGQQWPAGIGHDLDIGQHVCGRQTAQTPREVERVLGRNRIAVHDPQWIFALDDVDPRQRAPGSADRVESAAAAGLDLRDLGNLGFDDAFGAFQRFVRPILKGKAAERQRHAAPDAIAAYVNQFQRAAAEIADDAVGLVHAGNHAQRRQLRFARARQDFDFTPQMRSALAMKSAPLLASRQAAVAIA